MNFFQLYPKFQPPIQSIQAIIRFRERTSVDQISLFDDDFSSQKIIDYLFRAFSFNRSI